MGAASAWEQVEGRLRGVLCLSQQLPPPPPQHTCVLHAEAKNRHRRPANASATTPLWQSGMIWEMRHTPAFYEPGQLSAGVRSKLQHAHERVSTTPLTAACRPPQQAVDYKVPHSD